MTAVSDRPTRVTPDNPTINTTYLSEHLLGRWADLRKIARTLAQDERLIRDPHLAMDEHRERVLAQLKILVTEAQVLRAFPTRLGGKDDAGGGIAGFEELVAADPPFKSNQGCNGGCSARPSTTWEPKNNKTGSSKTPWNSPFLARSP